jgi:hypothetical protein
MKDLCGIDHDKEREYASRVVAHEREDAESEGFDRGLLWGTLMGVAILGSIVIVIDLWWRR